MLHDRFGSRRALWGLTLPLKINRFPDGLSRLQGPAGNNGAPGEVTNGRSRRQSAARVATPMPWHCPVFGELQDSLNQIWQVSTKRYPLFVLLKERVISFAMVFVTGFLMLVSFLFSAIIAAAGSFLHSRFPALDGTWEMGNSVISLLVIALLFAFIFRVIPDASITWGDVWLGAVIAAFLFVAGKFVLGFYFGRSAIASSYGAAGSLVIMLVWVYYSAQILFFGAEFTRVYALRFGSHRSDEGSLQPA
jgi:uncharacterized BrkB/YihY/UPF0761 family membrane protein